MKDKILIVEDDKIISELEKNYLSASGYEVDICYDGLSGLDAALEKDYALLILDVMLPGISGFDICRKVRQTKDVPVLFVTAKQEDNDVVSGFSLGGDDYITKPFNFTQLVARVNAHISRYKTLTERQSASTNIIEYGSLKMDKDSRRVYVDGNEVAMTNKEFELLWFLASHPNVVYSKDKLFGTIWGYEAIGETSTITVHINRIRDKIDRNKSGEQHIETVWGAGYLFRP